MKLKKMMGLSLAAMLCAGVAGCGSIYDWTQPKNECISEFLPHHELLVEQDSKFPFQYFYMRENAKHYDNIYVAPVNTAYLQKADIWAKMDKKLAEQLGQDIQKLAGFMRERYIQEFKECQGKDKPTVVDSPKHKNTVVMETAIVAIVPNKAELNALGLAGNFFLPGISIITARVAAGSIGIECKITDSETGEIVSMYAAVINDQAAILNLKALSWYGSAKRSIEKAAKDTAKVFATRDYSSIKRNFPFKLISL